MKKIALLLSAALLAPVAAHAEDVPQSNAAVFAGYSNPTAGFEDRAYTGFFYNQYLDNGVGVHVEGSYVNREEDGALGVVGLSAALANGVRGKVSIGTSTDVRSILPELVVRAELPVKLGNTIVTPEYSYKEYRTDVTDNSFAVNVAQYLNLGFDKSGYYVLQGRVSHNIVNKFKNTTAGSIGVTAVRANGVQFGVSGEYGQLAYSNVLEGIGYVLPGVESDFYAVRPSVSLPLSSRADVFARGEYSHNDFFETTGVMVGVKLKLN